MCCACFLFELLTCVVHSRGMYVCRTLSYKGAEFDIVEAPLDDKMMVIYMAFILNFCCLAISARILTCRADRLYTLLSIVTIYIKQSLAFFSSLIIYLSCL